MAGGVVGDAYESKRSIERITRRKQLMQAARAQAVQGTKVNKLRELGGNTVFVQGISNERSAQLKFIEQNRSIVKLRLGEKERIIKAMQFAAERFKEELILFNDGTDKDPRAMIKSAQQHMVVIEREGNTKIGDSYALGGTITNIPPFNLSQINDGLDPLSGPNTGYYNGNDEKRLIAVDNNNNQDLDLRGNHTVFEKFIRALKITAHPDIASGSERINTAQGLIDDVIDELSQLISLVGSEEAGIDQLIESQENRVLFYEEKYKELVGIDELEVATQFNNEKRVLDLAYQMLMTLKDMSLSNYLNR